MAFEVIENCSWETFKECIALDYSDDTHAGFLFRGQRDCRWSIESSLTRLFHRISLTEDAKTAEAIHLRNFILKSRGLLNTPHDSLNVGELWSIGQHYGLCTPLIDWTTSAYVAAYFAFSQPDPPPNDSASIFVLDTAKIRHHTNDDESINILEPLNGDNRRLVAQAGVLMQIPTGVTLENWLRERGLESSLIKFTIPQAHRPEVINDLRMMNISGLTLFPDLHGASIDCNMLMESKSNSDREMEVMQEALKRLEKQHGDN